MKKFFALFSLVLFLTGCASPVHYSDSHGSWVENVKSRGW